MVKEAPKSTSEESTQESAGVKENFAREIQELKAKGPLSPQEQARLNSLELALPYLKSENVSSSEPIMVTEEKASTPADTPLTESERSDGLEKQKDATAEYAGPRAKRLGGGEKIISAEKSPITEVGYEETGEKPPSVVGEEKKISPNSIFSGISSSESPRRFENVSPKKLAEEKPFTLGSELERGPEKESTQISPEAREAHGLSDKERLFIYRLWSGDPDAEKVDEKFNPSEKLENTGKEVFDLRNKALDAYETECRVRNRLEKELKNSAKGKERGRGKIELEKIWADNEMKAAKKVREEAEKDMEKALERLKMELHDDFRKRKKEAFPKLSQKDLEDESITYLARFLKESIKDFDQDLCREKMERARNAQEIGMLRYWLDRYQKAPRAARIAIGAGIAAGIGFTLPFLAPSAMYFGLTGGAAMGARSLVGGTLGGGLQTAWDKLFIRRKYEKQREEASERTSRELEGKLRAEILNDANSWMEDEAKKLKMMGMVDQDAQAYSKEMDDITRRESRTRGYSVLVTGLIGGGLASYASNIWDSFTGVPRGSALSGSLIPKEDVEKVAASKVEEVVAGAGAIEPSSVETAQEMNYIPSEPSSVETAQDMETNVGAVIEPSSVETAKETGVVPGIESGAMEPSSVETAQEMGAVAALDSKFAGKVYTVTEGDSLWSITRKMVKDGLVSEDQWKDGWQNSTVELANGKKVPLSETGLIHAGDQVKIMEEGGKISFAVEDYPHDTLKLSDNQGYYEYLKNAGKNPPKWLEDAVAMKSGAKSALEAQGAELHELVLSSTSESAEAAVAGEPLLFPEALRTDMLEEFNNAYLDRQEEIFEEIEKQRDIIKNLGSAAWDNPEQARIYQQSIIDATSFENELRASDAYLGNLEAMRVHLKDHGISSYFFNRVKDVTVGEFIALSKGEMTFADSHFGYLQNQFRLYPDKWQKIASFLELNQPGRPEKMLILEKFVKKLIG